MWMSRTPTDRKDTRSRLVAVAIDKDKGSQHAIKWATDNLLQRGQTVILIHVHLRTYSSSVSPRHSATPNGGAESPLGWKDLDSQTKELFLPFRCFCKRKDIQCKDIVLEDTDVAKALIEYVTNAAIEFLIIGTSTKTGFLRRFKAADIPTIVLKGSPDFTTIYVISKGKIQSVRSASRPAPSSSSSSPALLQNQIFTVQHQTQVAQPDIPPTPSTKRATEKLPAEPFRRSNEDPEFFRSPFTRKGYAGKSYGELTAPDTDISFVSTGRPSIDRIFPSFYDHTHATTKDSQLSNFSDIENSIVAFEAKTCDESRRKITEIDSGWQSSPISQENRKQSSPMNQAMDDVEAEMRRLKLELKQTMEMFSTAYKEAATAKLKARELQLWKSEEERKLEEARLGEKTALAIVEIEKAKAKAAIEAAEAAQRIAELESQKRVNAEIKALKEAEEKKKVLVALSQTDVRYRKYSIEEIEAATDCFCDSLKIGEGGYGPVYRCYLDHTQVAIKVLRPDAAQGRSQFQQEVEVLSCIRHPNMVLLLGACPEYGCLVYEFMAHGSLEDRLFRRGNSPPLSWQLRFRIAAEIGTALLFLHQTKPEPLVHRDLKPANILLDRNFVSKISDVGLARLVPPSVVDNMTQYRITSTAGTFCYIDPEYQQTGMLGIKSDIYSLGIMFLQVLTGKPPIGLTHYVERALARDALHHVLDPALSDWPFEEAKSFGQLALKCAELRRKDRPDLDTVVLPELKRLRAFAEATMPPMLPVGNLGPGNNQPNHSQVSVHLSDPPMEQSEENSNIQRRFY